VPNYGSMDSVISVLHNNGIKLLAFQYVYGVPHHWGNAVSETEVANMILDVNGIDGLLIDAEIQYDTLSNRAAAAQAYCDSIRTHHPESLVGLTAWARILGHATFPWQTFLDRVDVNMPQTYWAARPTTPQNELALMSSQFTTYTNIWVSQGDSAAAKPIMPLGQGEYFGYSNDVMQGDIASFCSLSQTTYGYPGVSLWEYNQIAHEYVWDEYTSAWQTTSVSTPGHAPNQYSLSQNYPNPFNPSTTITYSVPLTGEVALKVYDLLGREVSVLVNEWKAPGSYSVQFNANGLGSGVYMYRLTTGSFIQSQKMIVLK
jgi:Secretion system C-terminal sorting domain